MSVPKRRQKAAVGATARRSDGRADGRASQHHNLLGTRLLRYLVSHVNNLHILYWLGNLDSNQDKQSQSLLCYRYTIPQFSKQYQMFMLENDRRS